MKLRAEIRDFPFFYREEEVPGRALRRGGQTRPGGVITRSERSEAGGRLLWKCFSCREEIEISCLFLFPSI